MPRPSVLLTLVLGLAFAPPLPGQALKLLTRDFNRVQALARADSNDAEIQFYLVMAYWQKHKWPQTDSLLRLAVRLDPRFADGYLAFFRAPVLVSADVGNNRFANFRVDVHSGQTEYVSPLLPAEAQRVTFNELHSVLGEVKMERW